MAQYKQWQIQIFNKRTNAYVNDDAGKAFVLTPATAVPVTLLADQQGTSLTQPITSSGGNFVFYTAKSVTAIDFTYQMASGHSGFAESIASSVHRLDVYPEQQFYTLVVPIHTAVADTTVQDSGFDLLQSMVMRDAAVRIVSVGTNVTDATLDVGITATTNLFLAAIPEVAVGYNHPADDAQAGFIDSALVYYGAGLMDVTDGTNTTNEGFVLRKSFHQLTAENIVWQHNVTTGAITRGYILLDYSIIPTV